jgi:hypothetical protein
MTSSYGRRCRYCNRWISLRQMPHGQWVAFEGDAPHDCERAPPRTTPSVRRATSAAPIEQQDDDFEDFEMRFPRNSQALRPQPPVQVPPATVPHRQVPVGRDTARKANPAAPTTVPPKSSLQTQAPARSAGSKIKPRETSAVPVPQAPPSTPSHTAQEPARISVFGRFFSSVIGAVGLGAFYLFNIGMLPGWAFWMWMAIHFGSFGMFFFGLLGPFAYIAGTLGLWSLLFGAPAWLVNLVR